MRFYLLENPAAGRGKTRAFLDGVTHALLAAGHRVTAYAGRSARDLQAHAAALAEDELDVLLVVGGDGTLRTLLAARADPPAWPVGVVPAGTANLIGRELGTWPAGTPADLAARLAGGRPWPVDLLAMRRDDRPPELALAVISVGVDAALVHEVDAARARVGGKGGYVRWLQPGIRAVKYLALTRFAVQVDGGPWTTCAAAVIQNAHNYGGLFTLSPAARLDSGRAEVVLLDARTRRDVVRLVLSAGMGRIHRDQQVRIRTARRVHVRADTPVAVQADGDPAGFTDLEVRVLPGAMRLWRTDPAAP